MALINCPECNKEISVKVKACPHCGFPFEPSEEIVNVLSEKGAGNVLKYPKKKRTALIILGTVFIVIIILGLFSNSTKNSIST
jgi:uncharacterized membrane protein YvbJ